MEDGLGHVVRDPPFDLLVSDGVGGEGAHGPGESGAGHDGEFDGDVVFADDLDAAAGEGVEGGGDGTVDGIFDGQYCAVGFAGAYGFDGREWAGNG